MWTSLLFTTCPPRMKFIINQADFSKILTIGAKSILSKANLPILSNLLISTVDNGIEVLSTDLETAIRARVSCKVDKKGQTAVAGRTLLEFVAQLDEKDITVEKLGEEVVLSAEGYSARLATMPPEDFPAIPKIKKGVEFSLSKQELAGVVERVAFCAASDEGRPILTGMLCEISKDKMSFVATDGYRLSFDQDQIKTGASLPALKMIVPAKAMIEVGKIIAEDDNEQKENRGGGVKVVISQDINQATFKFGEEKEKFDVEFTTRLIEGEFPNWQKIIPDAFVTRAKIDKQEFTKLVRLTSIFARESGNIIKLKLTPGANSKGATLSVASQSSQLGSSDAVVDIELEGRGGEIAFNFRYLLEILAVVGGQEINFDMNESLNPGKITGVDPKDPFFHIIMPVRLQA